jgi:hypothetical protein
MAYAHISRKDMVKLLDFIHVERDTLVAHRDRTFTLRRRFTGDGELARAASLGKLCKNTKAVILEERFERCGQRGSLQIRFAYEEA